MLFRKLVSVVVSCSFILSGCVTTGAGFNVGPLMSSSFFKSKVDDGGVPKPRLDIVIPVFDPGLPEDGSAYEEEGVWPELRRAEAIRFSVKLKNELEKTGKFGAVRVTPDKTATGDLYILGTIDESDGEDVGIDVQVTDISGETWIDKSFSHEVSEDFHKDIRNKGKDPYDPLFQKTAAYIVEQLEYHAAKDLEKLQSLTQLRFGSNFSQEAFAPHMKAEGGRFILASMPNDNDPMLRRVQSIRVRDQLFVDRMQVNYESMNNKMNDSYLIWQEQSQVELMAKREAQIDAAMQAVGAVALIGLAVLAAAAGAQSNSYDGQAAGTAGAIVAGAAGAELLGKSFQTSEEAKVHRDALNELGQSIDMELAPQVVEFEKKTAELTGTAKEQFAQWRQFLQTIYAQEATPNVKL